MNLELLGTVVSAPVLNVSPGNLSLAPQMEIEGFVILPSSAREPVFRLGVVRLRDFANAVPLHERFCSHSLQLLTDKLQPQRGRAFWKPLMADLPYHLHFLSLWHSINSPHGVYCPGICVAI